MSLVRPALVAAGGLALAALSLLLPSAPDYDPLAWLVWGREVAALDLDTSSGPAWKPLPVAVTALLSFAGDAATSLWLVLARAGGLVAALAAALLARRLAPGATDALAAIAAAVTLLLVGGFARGVAVGNSEGILVAALLLAWERHLAGRRGTALALAGAGALLRVEVWPFLLAYSLFLWRREHRLRRWLGVLAIVLPLAWFGPDLWGSGDLLRSSERARVPNPGAPALAEHPAFEVLSRFAAMVPLPLLLGAAYAALRGCATLLAGAAAVWLLLVAAMSEVGYSGEERYLVPAAAAVAVLAGVGLADAVAVVGRTMRPLRAAALAGALVLLAAPVAFALPDARRAAADLRHAAALHRDLERAVVAAGGEKVVRSCGRLFAGRYRFPALAWRLDVHIADVSMEPRAPGVLFRSRLTRTSAAIPDPPAGFVPRAVAGEWTVFADCRSGA